MFQESEGGLHYLDTMQQQNHRQHGHVFSVNTVRDNKKNFTNNDYLQAVRARELQVMVGHPSDKDFIKILKTSSLPNCPVTPRDVLIANELFGPDVGALKGKTTRREPPPPPPPPPIVESPVLVDLTTIPKHRLVCRSNVCQQGASTGDAVTKHQVWHSGSSLRTGRRQPY